MKTFDVWMQGYSCTGQYMPDRYLGAYQADSFEDACMIAMKANNFSDESIKQYYNKENNSFWGCSFCEENPHCYE